MNSDSGGIIVFVKPDMSLTVISLVVKTATQLWLIACLALLLINVMSARKDTLKLSISIMLDASLVMSVLKDV